MSGDTALNLCLDMFIMGDKYNIPRLCTLSSSRFGGSLHACEDLNAFVNVIRRIYEVSAAKGTAAMRLSVLDQAVKWTHKLMDGKVSFCVDFRPIRKKYWSMLFERVLREIPEFASDFMERVI